MNHPRYRMPAEWEPHEATWITWPQSRLTWPNNIEAVRPIYAQMARYLSRGEDVRVLVHDGAVEAAARAVIAAAGADMARVSFHHAKTNMEWVRDYGPIFVTRRGADPVLALDFTFNSWGGKYPPWEDDNAIPPRIAAWTGKPLRTVDLVLEGGSIEVNGDGVLLTTESCLLNPNRNPHLSREQIEAALMEHLAIEKVLWLGDGIIGDDTDGHIDDLSRFTDARTIVTVVEESPDDGNHGVLRENLEWLHTLTNQHGEPFRIVTMPMPAPVHVGDIRLPASYANFYIGNAAVLVPVFDCEQDAAALAALRPLFPDREVVGIDAREMVVGLGAFHCLTQQQPATPQA